MEKKSEGCSLSGTVRQVCQQGEAKALELREKQCELNAVQAKLSSMEKRGQAMRLELKLTDRQLGGLACEIEQTQSHVDTLESEAQAILMENMRLKFIIEDEEENFRFLLAGYNKYRNQMECYRSAVALVESQADVYKQLLEKKQEVSNLKEKREELRVDLQNPEGNAVRLAQKEIDHLKGQVSCMKAMVRERGDLLLKEKETQSQLRKDIEIQSRRCEAIVRRLHCQLSKAQSSHRQLSSAIYQMEGEVQDLKTRLEVPNSD